MGSIEKWRAVRFESSYRKTPEFKAFCIAYRAAVKKQLAERGLEIVNWNNGHFYCSWFARNTATQRMVYGCCHDVRFFQDYWFSNVLIRTAKSARDYTGGANNYTTLAALGMAAARLTEV